MEYKTFIISLSVLSAIVVCLIGGVVYKIVSNKIENDKCNYVIRVPYGKSYYTYYTNEYEMKDGILLFMSDGKRFQHKGNYTIGENR